MPQYSFEITGRIEIRTGDYIAELSNQELSEPRLIALRRNLSENSLEDISRDSSEKLVEAELFELLRSYEGSIAADIRSRLERRDWRRRGPELWRDDEEPIFQISVRFSRGSLLYTLVITCLETAGPMIAKTGLGSLVVAAVEPILLDKVRYICSATNSITTYVRDVVVRSIAEPVAGSAATWADDKLRDYNDRLQKLAQQLDDTRPYRRIRALLLVVLGLLMANVVAVAAIARKIGLF